MVGGMGHASSVSLGYVLSEKKIKVFCLDGDGSLLMHMGSLATIGIVKPKNLIHVLFNNNAHDLLVDKPQMQIKLILKS